MEEYGEDRLRLLGQIATPADVEAFGNALEAFRLSRSQRGRSLEKDALKLSQLCRRSEALLAAWPAKARREESQDRGARIVKGALREARNDFARSYAEPIYEEMTRGYSHFVRAEELLYHISALYPGLCPTREEVEAELRRPLAEKEGVEMAQSDLLSHVLENERSGSHLIHAMLRPLPRSLELLEQFRRDGRLDLGAVQLETRTPLGCVLFNNLAYLNAEDAATLLPFETAVDLVLLHPELEMGLLRGNRVEHPKYRGRRIFSAGLNLTHLYQGKLPLMFYLTRDLGVVNKIFRGLSGESFRPMEPESTLEKLWIAALEGFAIGGGCQLLLVVDYVIAESGSYFNLPARKEGIVPGVSPMRLARFVGQRMAQQAVLFDKSFPVDSFEGRALVNESVSAGEMDGAIERLASEAARGGMVSAGAARKAIRIGCETPELFRKYMALYCRDQADCHFSPDLVANLERNWDARNRSG